MLSETQINDNKERFLSLINSIERDGVKKDLLLDQLNYSDFFTAPASTKYHADFKGGLCFHCLNVYDMLCKLIKIAYPDVIKEITNEAGETTKEIISTSPYSDDTIKIVALLHDLSKMKFYQIDYKNVKKFVEGGSKKELINGEWKTYDWVSEPFYKVRDADERCIFGNHQETALFMAQTFVPLTIEEAAAILNHMGIQSGMSVLDSTGVSEVYRKYPIATLLHLADMYSTFIVDSNESNN